MSKLNLKKRAAFRRRVQIALQEILNDAAFMQNVDCADLFVTVTDIEFGRTVRDIYLAVRGHPRRALGSGEEPRHEKYMKQAKLRGDSGYLDLTDVLYFPECREKIATELQHRLKLLFTPTIHWA